MPLLPWRGGKVWQAARRIFFASAVCRQRHFSDLPAAFRDAAPPGQPGWFTEGFDKRDLKEAKALLAELA